MRTKQTRILGIDPGSREMGLVILEDTSLLYYKVKSLKSFRPEKRLNKAIKETLIDIINDFSIDVMAVEKGWFSQNESPLFQTALKTILAVGNSENIKIVTYAPKTIRKKVCGNGKATKKRTARVIADRYPELEIYLEQNYRWKEKYWGHVFDALAAGLTYLSDEDS